jgi:CBS domain-containing protein
MVSNPYWCKHAKAYISEIKRWFDIPSMEDYLRLAIFFDAICVAGDASMLANLKTYVYERVQIGSPFMANFAKAAVLFETPIGLFTNLIANDNKIDVKKGGIFPIVHGVRSLALENAIPETDTVTRIKKLAKISIFDDNFADTLIEALDTLLNLRLKERFKKGDNVLVYDNFITISTLNQLELELLKDSFKIVNKFKKFLTHHFKLGMVS